MWCRRSIAADPATEREPQLVQERHGGKRLKWEDKMAGFLPSHNRL